MAAESAVGLMGAIPDAPEFPSVPAIEVSVPSLWTPSSKRYADFEKSYPIGIDREKWGSEHVVWLENIVNGLIYCVRTSIHTMRQCYVEGEVL